MPSTTLSCFHASDVCDPRTKDGADGDGTYRVAWCINPHMRIGATCARTARAQHERLLDAVRDCGGSITRYPFVRGCFDCVFAKDNAVLARVAGERRALLCRPRYEVRAREQEARGTCLRRAGFAITSARHHLEGGDVVRVRGGWLLGHGFRTESGAARELAEFCGQDVLGLELVDPYLYHLDTALAALDDGTVLVCRAALSEASFEALCAFPHVRRVIEIERPQALAFGLNLVQVGRCAILSSGAMEVESTLRALGISPIAVPLDQFHRAGGSAACLLSEEHALDTALAEAA